MLTPLSLVEDPAVFMAWREEGSPAPLIKDYERRDAAQRQVRGMKRNNIDKESEEFKGCPIG